MPEHSWCREGVLRTDGLRDQSGPLSTRCFRRLFHWLMAPDLHPPPPPPQSPGPPAAPGDRGSQVGLAHYPWGLLIPQMNCTRPAALHETLHGQKTSAGGSHPRDLFTFLRL
ncbi:unnamed protein product [Boreogadus saida]